MNTKETSDEANASSLVSYLITSRVRFLLSSKVSVGTANNTANKSWAGCNFTIHSPTSLH